MQWHSLGGLECSACEDCDGFVRVSILHTSSVPPRLRIQSSSLLQLHTSTSPATAIKATERTPQTHLYLALICAEQVPSSPLSPPYSLLRLLPQTSRYQTPRVSGLPLGTCEHSWKAAAQSPLPLASQFGFVRLLYLLLSPPLLQLFLLPSSHILHHGLELENVDPGFQGTSPSPAS